MRPAEYTPIYSNETDGYSKRALASHTDNTSVQCMYRETTQQTQYESNSVVHNPMNITDATVHKDVHDLFPGA